METAIPDFGVPPSPRLPRREPDDEAMHRRLEGGVDQGGPAPCVTEADPLQPFAEAPGEPEEGGICRAERQGRAFEESQGARRLGGIPHSEGRGQEGV